MSSAAPDPGEASLATTAEIHSALFFDFVAGHAQMAMMLLGKYPDPQSGQIEPPHLEGAKHFIDQLEMIEAKTRGNLTADESKLLQQMLSATRLAFAEVIDAQITDDAPPDESRATPPNTTTETVLAPPSEDELRVTFSKKY